VNQAKARITLATKITMVRLLGVPVFVVLLLYYLAGIREGAAHEIYRLSALILFIVIAATDALDGYLARRRGEITRLGSILDPIADKALMLSSLVLLSGEGHRAALDHGAGRVPRRADRRRGGYFLADGQAGRRSGRLLVSKLNTAAQIALAAAVLAAKAFGLPFGLWFTVAIYAVAGLTIASAAAYLTQWIRHMDL